MLKPYNGDPDQTCSQLNGRRCIKVCPTCVHFTHIRGVNPNTGVEVDKYDCVFNLLLLTQLEGNLLQRQTGAATESLRNEMVIVAKAQAEAAANVVENAADTLALQVSKRLIRAEPTRYISGT